MTDLKPGVKGRAWGVHGEILAVSKSEFWFRSDHGATMIAVDKDFTPDSPPPSTVMVEMDVEDALQFVHITGICDGTCGHSHCAAARPVRDALTKAGLA